MKFEMALLPGDTHPVVFFDVWEKAGLSAEMVQYAGHRNAIGVLCMQARNGLRDRRVQLLLAAPVRAVQ